MQNKLINFIHEKYKPGQRVFEKVISRHLRLTPAQAEIALTRCVELGILKDKFKYTCPCCLHSIPGELDKDSLLDTILCPNCGKETKTEQGLVEKIYIVL